MNHLKFLSVFGPSFSFALTLQHLQFTISELAYKNVKLASVKRFTNIKLYVK